MVNQAATKDLRNWVNALVQGVQSKSNGTKGNCHNCGSPDHWARECPKPKQNGSKGNNSRFKSQRNNPGRGNFGRGKPGRGNPGRGNPPTRTPPPKEGESEIKFINGKKSHWCSKCNRWTISHGTDSHKSKEELQAGNIASVARVSFNLHPSAHMVKGPICKPVKSKFPSIPTILGVVLLMSGVWCLMNECNASAFIAIVAELGQVVAKAPNFACTQGMLIVKTVMENWIWLAAVIMSGTIGFGTAMHMINDVEPEEIPTVRKRSGPAAIKQARRRFKTSNSKR